MASDDLVVSEVTAGNNFDLFLLLPGGQNWRVFSRSCQRGGKKLLQVENNFGMLEDRFGVWWMLEADG
ncbi:MAG: hypothetical protein GF417_09120 [Candidatus Latescibacteria bacterium]|nr:hypothetical protein [bacterium]MBD3424584.1 hypothetical protein [Candidatus Latescibacterota bacterium]